MCLVLLFELLSFKEINCKDLRRRWNKVRKQHSWTANSSKLIKPESQIGRGVPGLRSPAPHHGRRLPLTSVPPTTHQRRCGQRLRAERDRYQRGRLSLQHPSNFQPPLLVISNDLDIHIRNLTRDFDKISSTSRRLSLLRSILSFRVQSPLCCAPF